MARQDGASDNFCNLTGPTKKVGVIDTCFSNAIIYLMALNEQNSVRHVVNHCGIAGAWGLVKSMEYGGN